MFGGKEALSKSSQSVPCIAGWDYPPFWQCLGFAWCSLSQPVLLETEERLYRHHALLLQNILSQNDP